MENTETTLVPAIQAKFNEIDTWFQDIVESPVLFNTDINLPVTRLAIIFYCKESRVYITETHVCLDTNTTIELPTTKSPKEALQEAVTAALKEMSLVEVLSIVTASAV